ncbi:MAG TPA: helix-turn-helix domain-containing protein [Candidatus Lokiarchaeia archaeon]|nr:helix-turn-helix domain-containing protein [Candidatus Lokiarchaeia archaeon]
MPKVLPEYKELVKSKIIEAALKVFSLKGFYATRMLDIAKKIGMSKATLYFYFKSKEDLLRMISITINQKLGEIFRMSFEWNNFAAAAEIIYDRIADEVILQLPIGLEILSLASRDETIGKIARDDREQGLAAIQSSLQHQMDNGRITNAMDAHILAQLVLGLCWDIMLQQLIGSDQSLARENWINLLTVILEPQ